MPYDRRGNKNPKWRGGVIESAERVLVYVQDHPSGKSHILRYRAIMERHLGRYLNTDECIIHLNGDTKDDRIENLRVISKAESGTYGARLRGPQKRFTKRSPYETRQCATCKKDMFVAVLSKTKYCSNECRYISRRKPAPICPDCGKQIKARGSKCRECFYKTMRGANHHNWKGGPSGELQALRRSDQYKEWRTAVYQRDNYTCVLCGNGGRLEADHILPFASHLEERFNVSNGRTLCLRCHKESHKRNARIAGIPTVIRNPARTGKRLLKLPKTHCPQGHEFMPENTYIQKDGSRKCRSCNAARQREFRKTDHYRKWCSGYFKNK